MRHARHLIAAAIAAVVLMCLGGPHPFAQSACTPGTTMAPYSVRVQFADAEIAKQTALGWELTQEPVKTRNLVTLSFACPAAPPEPTPQPTPEPAPQPSPEPVPQPTPAPPPADTQAPVVRLDAPQATVSESSYSLTAHVTDDSGTVTADVGCDLATIQAMAGLDPLVATITLVPGLNTCTVTATDPTGNQTQGVARLTYNEPPPPPPPPPPDPIPTGGNDYFDAAYKSPKWFWGYSLRPRAGVTTTTDPYYEGQLAIGTAKTGYRGVTYNPSIDADPHRQDAAKIVIPAFSRLPGVPVSGTPQFTTVTDAAGKVTHPAIPPTPLSADALDFYVPYGAINSAWYQRSVMIDDEITGNILVRDAATGHVALQPRDTKHPQGGRGSWGTIAAAHAAGAGLRLSGNTVSNSPHIPIPKTEDGHSYFFAWDVYYTDSYVKTGLTNHKAFNLLSDGIWLEPDAVYSGGNDAIRSPLWNRETDVAAFSVRNYNILGGKADYTQNPPLAAGSRGYAGPNVTNNDYTLPILSKFIIKPNRWVRMCVLLEQTPGYDLVTIWIGDHDSGMVKTHDRLQLSLRPDVGYRVDTWVAEFNTSTDEFTGRNGAPRDLVAYVRNPFALRDLTADELVAWLKPPAAPLAAANALYRNLLALWSGR